VVLPLEGQPWSLLAGAIVPCDDAAGLLTGMSGDASFGRSEVAWCVLLAGWDGVQLPVAAVPLSRGPGVPPNATATVSPAFDAPLTRMKQAASFANEIVTALHVEPRRGRLWAALEGGALQSWELLGDEPKTLGRWASPLQDMRDGALARGFAEGQRVVAVCEDSVHSALVVATHGARGGPRLLRATLTA